METLTATDGIITKVIGPVIDVEFQSGNLPEIYTALNILQDDGTAEKGDRPAPLTILGDL